MKNMSTETTKLGQVPFRLNKKYETFKHLKIDSKFNQEIIEKTATSEVKYFFKAETAKYEVKKTINKQINKKSTVTLQRK